MLKVLPALQVFHVAFLALHDWIPLGRLNDVHAYKSEISPGKMVLGTLITTALFAAAPLASCWIYTGRTYPPWLWIWLWCSYGILFAGEIQSWWLPYFRGAKPELQARYRKMFGRTHAFLPERNGIVPNTLHIILHTATVATLVVLGVLTI